MRDIVSNLKYLEKQGEDNIWRTAKEAREEIENLRHKANILAETIRGLQNVVTSDCESKGEFITRIRNLLGADPDERVREKNESPTKIDQTLCIRRLSAIILWLEVNQNDVFSRGLWKSITDA